MPDAPSIRLHDLIRMGLRIAAVARVEAYRPSSQDADVVVLVQEERLVDGVRVEVLPTRIEGVPVLWPSGGSRGLTMGLDVGAEVLLAIRHRSHDEIDSNAGEGPLVPASTRRMSYSDAVAIPGYVRPAEGLPAAAFRADGQPVLLMPTGEAIHIGGSTAAFVLVRWDQLQSFLGTLKTWMDTHAHTHFMGPTGVPIVASPTAGNLASNRVKVTS